MSNNNQENIITLQQDPDIEYDVETIQKFIDEVFHDRLEGEEILTWFQKSNIPFYPKTVDDMFKKVERSKKPLTFYYGTSTCATHEDGRLYNRKGLFTALHVVVLDDIGTKIPFDKLPDDLIPNYKIETSEGNFQYGFILKDAIRSLELAEALIHLVYTSGVSDEGGKMPTKVVRLPAGVNGKKGDKRLFNLAVTEMNDDYWTPQELLDVIDAGVTWEEVVENTANARVGSAAAKVGTSLWSPVKATAATLSGIVDPLLEWMYETDRVINDNGGWVTIECPWSEDHSDGGGLVAGYSPVGRTDDSGSYGNQRGFKCLHDHCKDKDTPTFLAHMSSQFDAPVLSVVDNAAELVANYALVTSDDTVYRLRGVRNPTHMRVAAFRNAYPRSVMIYDGTDKPKLVKEYSLWMTAPNRLTLATLMYDPSSNERVIEWDGQKHLNTFTHPDWGAGLAEETDVKMFMDFLKYLLPKEEEREYFLDWLAAKVQDVCFKGAAMLMVAPEQGTGRTTLTDMMSQLFHPSNVSKVNFDTLINGTRDGAFNDWQESLMVTCDEVLGADTSKYTVYEAMKDMFDPRPKPTLINTKYGTKRQSILYTSYLLLTNHADAIGALSGDRRIYVMSNTTIPNTPEYFSALNDWMYTTDLAGDPAWCKSVWRVLKSRKVDVTMLNAPAPSTAAKESMTTSTMNDNDLIAKYVVKAFGSTYNASLAKSVVVDVLAASNIDYDSTVVRIICNIMKQATDTFPSNLSPIIKVKGSAYRVRINRRSLIDQGFDIATLLTDSKALELLEEAREMFGRILDDRHSTVKSIVEKVALHAV